MYDFIADLDEYFCEKYANYDKLCVMEGYRMPKMHASEVRADGRTYAYTLPANTMRLATQEKKTEILAKLKTQIVDKTFSFTFVPLKFGVRMRNKYSQYGFVKTFLGILSKYNLTTDEVGEQLEIQTEIWKEICKGNYLPTKNLLFTIALTSHLTIDDLKVLLTLCDYEFDFALEKDVVVAYLLEQKVFNPLMQQSALAEYKIINLFFKKEEMA